MSTNERYLPNFISLRSDHKLQRTLWRKVTASAFVYIHDIELSDIMLFFEH